MATQFFWITDHQKDVYSLGIVSSQSNENEYVVLDEGKKTHICKVDQLRKILTVPNEKVNDISKFDCIDEPTILYCLRKRWKMDLFYVKLHFLFCPLCFDLVLGVF
jgi:myosin heavy subunit